MDSLHLQLSLFLLAHGQFIIHSEKSSANPVNPIHFVQFMREIERSTDLQRGN
jgi:hypothetical protein